MNTRFKLYSIVSFISLTSACIQQAQILAPPSATSENAPLSSKLTSEQKLTPISPDLQKKVNTQPLLPAQLHKIEHNGIKFHIVTFDSRKQELTISDQLNGPGSLYKDAQAATRSNNGIAAINAGFFTPEGKPLGIVISNGSKRGSYNTSSLGTGIYYHTKEGAQLSRRSIWNTISKNPPAELLQSGPMLLEHSKTVAGLSNKSERVRSFMATDGENHWCIGHASSCTLKDLSAALQSIKVKNFDLKTALNLDGGRSSDLWVSSSITNGPINIRPFWNKPVRNFLVLKNK